MKRIFVTVVFIFFSLAAFALPSVDGVQAEVNRGNYAQAEAMMREVVAAKPNSAKAHYLYAEILAHNKSFDLAAQEARLARQNDPAIKFTSPEKFRNFEELIQREQRIAATPAVSPRQAAPAPVRQQQQAAQSAAADRSLPGWVWGLGGAILAFVIWRMVTASQRRQQQALMMPMSAAGTGMATYGGAPYGGGGVMQQPGYGPMAPQGGSGMLGTGLAVAGGFAAGMMAEKLFDGSSSHRAAAADGGYANEAGQAGFDTPMRNDAAEALEQRPIDFGSGGDWGGDAGDGGGGGDGGGDGGW
jgi:hypothetical protein